MAGQDELFLRSGLIIWYTSLLARLSTHHLRRVTALTSLPVGAAARLHDTELDTEARELLRGLGLTDRSIIRVCKQGEPCVVQVHATRIGLTSRVARAILVEPIEGAVLEN